jgi:hypothetical protein
MFTITANTIPHEDQRYDTAGDYIDLASGEVRLLFISEMGNTDYEFLVLIHELIEQHLCLKRGIPEPVIADFDIKYSGEHSENPGLDPAAPYHKEHMFAERIEEMVGKELGIDMEAYNAVFDTLEYPEGK